jgi:NADPH:quinone reductase-like Zn-dependent oxidoreductase
MRAIEQSGFGDPRQVLDLTQAPVPQVKADHALVRVRASSANPTTGTSSAASQF